MHHRTGIRCRNVVGPLPRVESQETLLLLSVRKAAVFHDAAGFNGVQHMQMLCKVSNAFSDVRCPVCEQGFMVYWTRIAAKNRDEQRQSLLNGLRLQHGSTDETTSAHPAAFHLADGLTPAPFGETAGMGMPALLGVYN